MSKYFSVYDYDLMEQEGKDIVDRWMADNNIDPTIVTLVEGGFEGQERIVVSGLPYSSREATQADIMILRDIDEDTFPWEEVASHMPMVEPEAEDISEATEEFVVEGVAYGSNV